MAAGSPVIGERLLGGVGLAAPAGRAEPTAGAGMAVERAREERRGRRRWLSDRLWHTASTTSAAALMGLDSATEAALLRLRAAAAGGDLDALQHAVDEADAVVAESYDRPHSVTEDGALGGGDGAQGLAELTACLHDVKERLATANLQQAMLLQSEETEAIVAGTPEGAPCCARPPRPAFPALLVIIQAAGRCVAALELTRMRVCARAVLWNLTPDEAEVGGGDGAAASALEARFAALGWDSGEHAQSPPPPQSPQSPPRTTAGAERSVSRGSRGDEI
jgi:hypothetical protein